MIAFSLCGLLVAQATAAQLRTTTGVQSYCRDSKRHTIVYNVTGPDDDSFVDLDQSGNLESLECDVDQTKINLKFHSELTAAKYYAELKFEKNKYLVGGQKKKTKCPPTKKNPNGYILRRPLDAIMKGQYVIVHAVEAQYDEVFESADIAYSTHSDPECVSATHPEADKEVCIGINTDNSCAQASGPVSIYTNQFLSVTCTDCFVGLQTDVFLEVSIRGFQVQKLAGGFRNSSINAALVAHMQAQAGWSTGVDKTLMMIPSTTLLDFRIGLVPFLIMFDAPVEVKADIQLNAQAEATAGVTGRIALGGSSISWSPKHHWQHTHLQPQAKWTTQVSGDASFSGSGSIAFVPSLMMHVDKIFTYAFTLSPQANLQVAGDTTTKKICANATVDMSVTSRAELVINIPWANIHEDKVWGPKVLYESGQVPVLGACN